MARPSSAAARAYAEAPLPDGSTPWREATYTAIDFELTGLDPAVHEIISFAAVTVEGGRVHLDDTRYRVVRPRRMPNADTIRIHGLREADLAAAPPLDEVLDDLLEALTGRVLLAHVAPVETGFLSAALSPRGLSLRNPVVDTANLAVELRRRRRQPPLSRGENADVAASSPGLSTLADSLGLPAHRPHHAQGDALTTAQVFLALATHLEELGQATLGSLERLSRPERRRISPSRLLRRLGLGQGRA